jgi:hypothetical protein
MLQAATKTTVIPKASIEGICCFISKFLSFKIETSHVSVLDKHRRRIKKTVRRCLTHRFLPGDPHRIKKIGNGDASSRSCLWQVMRKATPGGC